ncbi:MAG TPA: phenylalanine--tRNA ligase subunit beta [Defluviitaleaceae bacterium]|nr:phenylalanine--tRNA ligase subunit beta [Candidatus Epulonipiscium sp.]HOQ15772.1 phenylalanine--tRNA ligase subunit beta [Defluviitaleaceae bacterium]HQD49513.1 phenylalanine--tRNA ligase subunit beta [Defluviitaleaceae bacterium]
MNIPMSWLKDYVPVDCDIKTFADAMTMSGSNVENYVEQGKEISNVVVGKILSVEKHPDADKLLVTKVDVGTEVLQIVTGAHNIKEGDYVPIALHGASLPGGIKIKTGKLRGVESQGMMCSINELGFEKEDFPDAPEDGIYILSEAYPLGKDIKEVFGLNDIVVEYEITSNRPDCFSVVGIAREAAATFKLPFKYPEINVKESGGKASDYVSIEIANSELCPRYAARIIKNVKIQPSPKWMRQRLLAAGIRPINNIVDITNYVMLELGQPMHAFDYDKLKNKKILVRNAKAGEKIMTLDGETRDLDETMLVITDGENPIAVGGVMGGEESKVTEDTKTILFESANFNGANIRVTAKKLGLRTDASVKYSKGLDPNLVIDVLNRAAQLVIELGAGEVVEGIVDVYPNKREAKTIPYSVEKINGLLGITLSEDEIINYFTSLEFKVDREAKTVTIPTFRPDIEGNADLAEEVARLYGYDKITPSLERGKPTVGKKTYSQRIEDLIKITMEAQGFYEIMNYTFESPKVFEKLNISEDSDLRKVITISNPLGEDFSIMRTQTLNGMLTSLSINYNRRNEEVLLYEIGKVYIPKELPLKELPEEKLKLTLGMYGNVDFYDLKGSIEVLFEKLGMSEKVEYSLEQNLSWMHPGRCASISCKNKKIGYIGEVHPNVAENYDINTRVYVGVIDVSSLVEEADLERVYKPLPKYPAVSRDIAMLVKDEIPVKDIENIIRQRGGKILESYSLFDVYKGKQIQEGYKSVAYSITFRAQDRTLTEEEVNKAMQKIINGLESNLGAHLRE